MIYEKVNAPSPVTQPEPTPTDTKTPSPFRDITPSDYFYDAAMWARNNGIAKGQGSRQFNPNATCTRAEMLTFLWRACGSPEPTGSGKRFKDVPAGAYYEKAIQWAADNKIVKGAGSGKFNPGATITRAEAVTFLYREAGSPTAVPGNKFADVGSNAYYAGPVQWAVDNGIAKGVKKTKFSPDEACTRAQIVTFLYRAK